MISDNRVVTTLESSCCFLASLFPKVFCTSVLTWSLYVLLFVVPDFIQSSFILTVLNIIGILLYSLCIFTYYRIILVGPGSPLDYEELKISNVSRISENPYDTDPVELPPDFLVLHTMKVNGTQGFRYCAKCSVWKPDRCHHCSSSGKCILKWIIIVLGFLHVLDSSIINFSYNFYAMFQFIVFFIHYMWVHYL